MLGAATGRGAPQVRRLALIYALLDGGAVVEPSHLRAALAVWRYSADSAALLFGKSLGDPTADRVLAEVRQRPEGLRRTELSRSFAGHKSKHDLDRAIALLVDQGLIEEELEESKGGRRPVLLTAVDQREKRKEAKEAMTDLSLTSLLSPTRTSLDRLPEPMLSRDDFGAQMALRGRRSRCAPILLRSVQKSICLTHTMARTFRELIELKGGSYMKEVVGKRRERTRAAGECQICERSVSLTTQYTVINDLVAGKPVKRKNAARKGAEKLSHYCGDCADKRVTQKQTWINARTKRLAKESA